MGLLNVANGLKLVIWWTCFFPIMVLFISYCRLILIPIWPVLWDYKGPIFEVPIMGTFTYSDERRGIDGRGVLLQCQIDEDGPVIHQFLNFFRWIIFCRFLSFFFRWIFPQFRTKVISHQLSSIRSHSFFLGFGDSSNIQSLASHLQSVRLHALQRRQYPIHQIQANIVRF